MVGELPPAPGEGPTTGPPSSPQWAPVFPPQPPPRPRAWSAIALAAIAILLGVAALVVALARPTSSRSEVASTTSTTPSYSTEQAAAAHQKLCDAYALAARAVQIATNGDNQALSGVATVNGAVILEHTVSTTPAISAGDRAVALALAEAYSNAQATATTVLQRDDPLWQSTISDVNAKDAAMKKVCER